MVHSKEFLERKIKEKEAEVEKLSYSNKYHESYIQSRIEQLNSEIEDMEDELNYINFGGVF